MASGAIIGKGTTIKYGSTALGEVFKVTPPTIKLGDVDVTHYGTTGDIKETISAGFKDVGTVVIECNYLKAERATVMGMVGTSQTWTITYPDDSTEVFSGYINELGMEVPNEDKLTQKITIKVTSMPVFSAGS